MNVVKSRVQLESKLSVFFFFFKLCCMLESKILEFSVV